MGASRSGVKTSSTIEHLVEGRISPVFEINYYAVDEGEAAERLSRTCLVDRVFGAVPPESVWDPQLGFAELVSA
jgi:hypothetical protein